MLSFFSFSFLIGKGYILLERENSVCIKYERYFIMLSFSIVKDKIFLLVSYTHPVGLKPTTSSSTLHLQGEEMPVELKLIECERYILETNHYFHSIILKDPLQIPCT
jgi:hypothetical protein